MNKLTNLLRRYWFAVAFALLAGAVALVFNFRDEFADYLGYSANKETAGVLSASGLFVRDALLFLGAVTGIAIAFWRNYLLDKQNQAAIDNAKAAAKNAEIANARLLSDQFASSAELMAKDTLKGIPAIAARVNGIYVLRDLAFHKEKWQEFAPRVIRNLMAYIKDNAQRGEKKEGEVRPLGEDVKTAFVVLEEVLEKHGDELQNSGAINKEDDLSFAEQDFSHLDLNGKIIPKWERYYWAKAKFIGANLQYTNLRGAIFCEASLQKANLKRANLEGAIFSSPVSILDPLKYSPTNLEGANLNSANMRGADFTGTYLAKAELSSADLTGANFALAHLGGAKFFKEEISGIGMVLGKMIEQGRRATFSATNLIGVTTTEETIFPHFDDMQNCIWHSGFSFHPEKNALCKFGGKSGVVRPLKELKQQESTKEKLKEILAQEQISRYGFARMLQNFLLPLHYHPDIVEPLREAAKELYKEGKWPEGIPPHQLKRLIKEIGIPPKSPG